MGAPITEDEFARASGDLVFRRALMARALSLLLGRIAQLRAARPAAHSAAARQLRDGIDLAVSLSDRLQGLTKTLDGGPRHPEKGGAVEDSDQRREAVLRA
jgi:hypothetical protein